MLLRRLLLLFLTASLLAAPAAAADPLAEALTLPVASGLIGAKDVARFAWVERAGGTRRILVANSGGAPSVVAAEEGDSGIQLSGLAFSPDGTRLAYVRGGDAEFPDDTPPNPGLATEAPGQEVFVAELTGRSLPIGRGHSPIFSPDGARVAFVRQGEIWLWSPQGDARRVAKVRGDVSRLSWSPNGSQLLFTEGRGDHGFIALLDLSGERLRYLDPGLGDAIEPVFSPDGRQIAYVRYIEPPSDAAPESGPYWSISVVDLASGAARALWTPPAGEGGRWAGTRGRNLFWTATGYLIFPWERDGWLHPYAVAASGGTPRELTRGAFEVEAFGPAPGGKSIIYSANADDLDRRQVWRVSLNGGAPQRLTSGAGMTTYPVHGGSLLAVIASDASRPAHPAIVGRGLEPLAPIPALTRHVLPEPVVFRAEDGMKVHAQLFRSTRPGTRPALVFVHGGPRRQMLLGFHPSGYYSNAYVLNQHLALSGYHVLAVNYRSGTGYGRAFRDAPDIARAGAAEYRDVLAAGRWLAARAEVDPRRIGIWGGSWGGYLTALALSRNSDVFAAGVDFHGVHSMLRPVPNSLSPEAQATARQLQWSSSPLATIDRWRSPVLLIHGDDDRNVDFSQSVVLARELTARGISYREIAIPNERHGFLRHEAWLESYRATVAFFDEMLKPR